MVMRKLTWMTQGRDGFHRLLLDVEAQKRALAVLLVQARQYGFSGYPLDFENIAWADREVFSAFARRTAEALHAAGFQLSIAVVPNEPGHAGRGAFSKWMWEYWPGVYDLKALGDCMDFVSLMTARSGGFSAWVLGAEDPAIWNELPRARH
jgi:spore germination protein YaaH